MVELILFLPLISAALALAASNVIGARTGMVISLALMTVAALLSWLIAFSVTFGGGGTDQIVIGEWFVAGDLDVAWTLRLDALSAVFFVIITTLCALAQLYALGAMADGPRGFWFNGCLSLLAFALLLLVSADNFAQLFFGWEGALAAAFMLIAFEPEQRTASSAPSMFVAIHRVGSIAILLAIGAVLMTTGSLNFNDLFAAVPLLADEPSGVLGLSVLTAISVLFAITILVRAGQVFVHGWWSAAATAPITAAAVIAMVGAGSAAVFLAARLSPLWEFSSTAGAVFVVFGALTAVLAAAAAGAQQDTRMVGAFAASSQLGVVLLAVGVGAYGVAVLHFIAAAVGMMLLKLVMGSVAKALQGEYDLRRMGGLWRQLPFTHALALVAVLSLTGLPFTTGQISRELIASAAFDSGGFLGLAAYALLLVTAFLTALFGWRLIFLTFYGKQRAGLDTMKAVREPSIAMSVAMVPLAICALAVGLALAPAMQATDGAFWGGSLFSLVPRDLSDTPFLVVAVPVVVSALGTVLAVVRFWGPAHRGQAGGSPIGASVRAAAQMGTQYKTLVVLPAMAVGQRLWWLDSRVIDRLGAEKVPTTARQSSKAVGRMQSGYLYHYVFVMIAGLAVVLALMLASAQGFL